MTARMRGVRSWHGAAHRDPEEGSILPLIIGFAALLIGVIVVITAATALYLERKQLFTVADGAALVGAESFELDQVRVGSDGSLSAELRPEQVHGQVVEHLGRIDLGGFENFTLIEATTVDASTATVTLRSQWRPPILGWFLPEGIVLEVTATARSVFG